MAAQDISVGKPMLLPAGNKADTPPALKTLWEIPCTKDLKKCEEHTYVIIEQYIDSHGRCIYIKPRGSVDLLLAIKPVFQRLQCAPALKDGEPVDSASLLAVIYNPPSARRNMANAEPRLLNAAPVILSEEKYEMLVTQQLGVTQVVAAMEIDASGALTAVGFLREVPHASLLEKEIIAAMSLWQFEPARFEGRPVAGTIYATLMFTRITKDYLSVSEKGPPKNKRDPWPTMNSKQLNALASQSLRHASIGNATGDITKPKILQSVLPEYPQKLKEAGIAGTVIIQIDIDKQGNAHNPKIIQSDNAGFNKPAINALLKTKFSPGSRNGRLVNTRVQVPVCFSLTEDRPAQIENNP